jgi:CheY-like chemotaxis protein
MRSLPDPQRAKPCVLVIDDDETVAWAIAARLGQDFRVVGLADPGQAVEVARRERPGVILCDIDMPGIPGDDVAFALSQDLDTNEIPLVYLSALVDSEEAPDLEGVFGDHVALSKNASTEELRDVVAAALRLPDD